MKKLIYSLLSALMLFSLYACSKYDSVSGDPLDTKIYTLKNGLKVFMSVNKETPRIQTYVAVHVGGKNDPAETTGLAHYFEHLMFKGTKQFGTSDYAKEEPMLNEIERLFEVYRQTKDSTERIALYRQIDSISYEASKISIPNEYDKLMANIGAQGTNAWTSKDETVYTEDIPSNQIDNWARIQADRFRNTVIRGFHTELETIYEEKNMSLTKDIRKVYEGIDALLFPHHPYGKQSVLGTQEHLKNPSITNVKKYHDQYYVPNNIAICVSGDFEPDSMVAAIEKYFGDWEPNPEIPVLTYEKEEEITAPKTLDVYGLESEMLLMGWPLPGASDLNTDAVASVASMIMGNGSAGLIDIDVKKQQKVLNMAGGYQSQPDYGKYVIYGTPKEGQTLEEVRDIALKEIEKLRKGEFDEDLIQASLNNLDKQMQEMLEDNESRAELYVEAFINNIDWKDAARVLDRYKAVTKKDVMAFAEKYLGEQNYAIVYKHQGVDTTVMKIQAPHITPIETNRDAESAFLKEIKKVQVKPIEPLFVDFNTDMAQMELAKGIHVLYKQNEQNDLFHLQYAFNSGTADNPALGAAQKYVTYLGTDSLTAETIAKRLYGLACSFNVSSNSYRTVIEIEGLNKNMAEAVKIVEDLLLHAKGDSTILQNVKADIFKQRVNAKANQGACFSALKRYAYYGPDFIQKTTLKNEGVASLSSDDLTKAIASLFQNEHEILYYGPMSQDDLKATLADAHYVGNDLQPLEEHHAQVLETPANKVLLAPYDAKQLYYLQSSNRGETFDASVTPVLKLYDEYFGGSMNSISFQEMREARGLAYSAWAQMFAPDYADDNYVYLANIATQNDKMVAAIEAFADIINNMPRSEAAFGIAKEGLIATLRSSRIVGMDVLEKYIDCRRLGLDKPQDKEVFDAIQKLTMDDIVAFQQKWVKDRHYTYSILGDIKNLDTKYLSTVGPVQTLTLEEIFGY